MRAYKVLIDGRSPFTSWRWPLPEAGKPGEWVQASGPVALCANGIHASTVDQLPPWLGPEIWTIELDGEMLETDAALVASRARLLARVTSWNQSARNAFAEACAGRARAALAEVRAEMVLLEVIDRLAAAGQAAPAGYWSAVIVGERAAGRRAGPRYDAAFAGERAAQADWLRSELGLAR